jgi:hypothetical protein
MHALGECECCFKPTDFLNLLELHASGFGCSSSSGAPAATDTKCR